jgi:hypothetical protein
MYVRLPFHFLFLIAAAGCSPGAVVQQRVTALAKEQLGNNIVLNWNSSKTVMLAYQHGRAGDRVSYMVIRRDLSVIRKGSYRSGYIHWIDNTTIEYLDMPGTLREGEDLAHFKKTITIE